KIFISWSGETSAKCAEELREWLPYMNPTISPFVSSRDITKGERGLPKIASELQDCSFGVVCVSRNNQAAPWINFEAGALSRELGESKLAPFLLDLPVKDLEGPLTQFQATDSRRREDVWDLVTSINERCETSIENDRLSVLFDRFWGDLETRLNSIRETSPASPKPERKTDDILNELVALVREQTARIQRLENLSNKPTGSYFNYTFNEPREIVIESDASAININRPKEAKERVEIELLQIVGAENVLKSRTVHRHDSAVSIVAGPDGVVRARGQAGALLALATRHQTPIIIESTTDGSLLRWEPEGTNSPFVEE
ncbi:toll/interleukin-1 receptor domain-containing protein, partial [Streptomyces halstedii]|uniref:toll/interleukin-1 receptor domain-containing protein n=1 Tax=Streptomyces halstedii TaxID=1944 RepID=UPI0033500A2E